MKSGKTAETDYFVTIPFEYRAGLPIIEVQVNNEKGWFLFDTGALNVISKTFEEKLKINTLATGSVEDSGGNTVQNQSYVRLSEIDIGGVHFMNTGALVLNLNTSDALSCFHLDGIIGANLMRKSFWKINYEEQTITLTNDLKRFKDLSDYEVIEFNAQTSGTPLIKLTLNDLKVKKITFDTGSDGHISVPTKELKRLEEQSAIDKTYSVGSNSYGANGRAISDTTYFGNIQKIKVGTMALKNKVIEFSKYSDRIGTSFLKNYNVIVDWKHHHIYLQKIKEYKNDVVENFGFGLDLRNNRLYVGSIYENSASKDKLKIGDQILEIDEFNFQNLTNTSFCELVIKKNWPYRNRKKISITIKRNNQVLKFEVEKEKLLPKKKSERHKQY